MHGEVVEQDYGVARWLIPRNDRVESNAAGMDRVVFPGSLSVKGRLYIHYLLCAFSVAFRAQRAFKPGGLDSATMAL